MSDRQSDGDGEYRITFDAWLVGRRAEADGGHELPGTNHGVRQQFEGRLTGRCLEYGDPPWRWLELGDLIEKPEAFADAHVWCDESFVYMKDDDRRE